MITEKQFRQVFPRNQHPTDWLRWLNDEMAKFDINSPLRVAHFLAQIAVESAELTRLKENLSYSPQRLVAVWPKRFPTVQDALPYSRNPEKLGNKVYANRLGNGDEMSGDGFRYRGRGVIQITGRSNYAEMSRLVGKDFIEFPDSVLEPRYAVATAAAFWKRNGLNEIADKDDVMAVTKRVNGGTNGLEDRKRYLAKAKEVLSDGTDQSSEVGNGRPAGRQGSEVESGDWFD